MKKILSILVLLTLTACAKNPATGSMDMVFMSEEAEFEIGHEAVRNSIKEHGLYKEDKEFVKYYQSIANRLVDVTERSEKPFEFIMLDSEQFNAFATPGYINIYRGIIPFMNNESEFTAVMAHEAGHITARHAVRGDATAKIGTGLFMVGAILLGANSDNQAVAQGALGLGLFAMQAGFASYSRAHEDEADELALRYMEALKLDPREAAGMYKTMHLYGELRKKIYKYFNDGKNPPKSPYYDLLASHPEPMSRVEKVIERKGALAKNHISSNREAFLKQIDGMAFGANFRQHGTVGERNLYDQNDRLMMTMPEGFFTAQLGGKWRSYNNVTKAEASVYKKTVAKAEDPEETLRVMFPKLRQIRPLDINGFEAYTGTQKLYKKGKQVAMQRVFGYKLGSSEEGKSKGKDFYIVSFNAPNETFNKLDPTFFESAESFKRLTKPHAESIQPLRIKIHTVRRGDTVENLSKTMPFGDLKEEWFRALNGLELTDKIKVGSKVKRVVDPNLELKL